MIKINNLIKEYKNRTVVDVKELSIPNNMIFGIVGGNGSGKSTLLKIIAELLPQTSGTISRDVALDEMVYLFQKPHMFNTSVYHNIAYPLKFRKFNKNIIEEKVNQMIDLFDLKHIKDQNALSLSGGESQKVNLARALVFDPKWILLDEPTANIDPKSTMQIEKILKSIEMNMVIVTHSLNQAKRLCDQVAVMAEGQILEVNTPEIALKNEVLVYV
ncbi:MAG: ATP-binding cassette domain-containing protein [Clostridiales bacterium]|nr:ATP-binding cassette domain-containing protein [Clostridiales bacterium]